MLKKDFRKSINQKKTLVVPGVFDCLGARIVEHVGGFDALYLTGFGVTATLLGKPDLGFVDLTEMLIGARNIKAIVALPLIVDCDTGYGNIIRTVQEMERVGVNAIQLEDQIIPQKLNANHLPEVVSLEKHCEKIQMAKASRTDRNFLIIGRTDALVKYGIKEAIKRGIAYHKSGADIIFVHGAKSKQELKIICKEIPYPNIVNYSTLIESGIRPIPSVSELGQMGFKIIIFPGEILFSAANIIRKLLLEIKSKKTLNNWIENLMNISEFKAILDI